MKSLYLGEKDRWDIGIGEDGNFVFVEDDSEVVQNLRERLLFIYGEWIYDITKGVPYYEHILIDNYNLRTIESILKKEILEHELVNEIVYFSMSLNNLVLNVEFKVKTNTAFLEGEL